MPKKEKRKRGFSRNSSKIGRSFKGSLPPQYDPAFDHSRQADMPTGRGNGCFDLLIVEFDKSLESDHHMPHIEMITINFNLRNPKADSRTAICLIYR